MSKDSAETNRRDEHEMRAEYDFAGCARGRHYRAMQAGYTITIHQADGTSIVKEVKPKEGAIVLAPDVRENCPDSESVNAALRGLVKLNAVKRRRKGKPGPDDEDR
ncbi:MAG: hypothetical protein AB1646_02870 [Thermodesulfobacteriota bacterium]